MAPLDFKHMTSAKYRPGEDDAVNYYAQKRKKQYHGNESKEVKELSMKRDKKLPNLKVPVKGKKGISRFMRKKAIGQAKDDLNASVQSADRKPERYIKPDGKVGIRMVKTDKEVIKKESSFGDNSLAARLIKTKQQKKNQNKINHSDAHRDAQTHSDGSMSVKKIPSMIKKPGDKHLHLHMKSYHKEKDGQDFAKKHGYKVKNYVKTQSGTRMDIHKEEVEVDEALTLQQRMKRSRLMKRMKTRIKIGRDRARRKMANKQKLEKRAMRQARAQIAKKLTRGIPKGELSFARKQEIEKRLDKPALKQRIKRIAKRIFKDVRKKEVQRKKG